MAMGGLGPMGGQLTPYKPVWDAVFEGWSRRFVGRNHWRVAAILDPDEATQECALVFARCARHYTGKVDNPAWFMSLYKVAVSNHFNNLALSNERAMRAAAAAETLPRPSSEFGDGPLLTALGEASVELRQVLVLALVTAPQELARLMLGGPRGDPAAWSRALCRWARLPVVRNDLIRELKKLLD